MNPLHFAALVRDLASATSATDRDLKMGWVPSFSVLSGRASDVVSCPVDSLGVAFYRRPDGRVRVRVVGVGLFADAWLPARPTLAPYQRFAELAMVHLPEAVTRSTVDRGVWCPGWKDWLLFQRPNTPDGIGP